MKFNRAQFGKITFRSHMPKLRWLWTSISLIYAVLFPLLLLQNRQISTILLSQQPPIGQPVVDQLGQLALLFEFFFCLSVVLTLIAWVLWASGESKMGENSVS